MRAGVSARQWLPIPPHHCPSPSLSSSSQLPVSAFPLFSLASNAPSFPRGRIQCSAGRTPSPGSGENESKAVLDAFFLGKAFAEALNERIGSTVGEILSVIGQFQAEQQKQVQDFQEEVMERAKKAKEQAALEVTELQSDVPKTFSAPSDNGVGPVVSPPTLTRPSPASDPFQDMFKD